MKKQSLLILSIVGVSLAACGGKPVVHEHDQVARMVIETMRNLTHNATFEGTYTLSYPGALASHNTSVPVLTSRDYGHINGLESSPRAVRVNQEYGSTTYYQSEDGRVFTQIVNPDNTVVPFYLSSLGNFYRYENRFPTPFDSISESDFDEEMNLNATKAYHLFTSYTGEFQPVLSAKATIDEEYRISKIDFVFGDSPIGITAGIDVITVEKGLTGSLTFDYGIAHIDYLKPYTSKSSSYETALANLGNNYLLRTESQDLVSVIDTYVVGDTFFQHLDSSVDAPVEGDVYAFKRNSGYRLYLYNGAEWTRQESVDDLSDYLPAIESVSPYIIEEATSTHLSVKEEACANGVEQFMLPGLGIASGTGLSADIYLRDGTFNYVTMTFLNYGSSIVVKNTYLDHGTAAMPVWLDAPGN